MTGDHYDIQAKCECPGNIFDLLIRSTHVISGVMVGELSQKLQAGGS